MMYETHEAHLHIMSTELQDRSRHDDVCVVDIVGGRCLPRQAKLSIDIRVHF